MMARLARGVAANGFGQAVTVGSQILSVPLLIRAWGAAGYGTWVLLAAIPTALAFADGGLAVASGNAMTMMIARGETAEAAALFRAIRRTVTRTCVGLAAATILSLVALPSGLDTLAALPLTSDNRLALAAIVGVVLLGTLTTLPAAALRAGGHYAGSVTAGSIVRLAEVAAILVAANAGGGLAAAALAWLVARGAGMLWLFRLAHRRLPWLMRVDRGLAPADLRAMRAPALASLAMPVGFAAGLQGVTIAIGAALAPEAVALFSATRTLARASVQLAGLVNHALMPEMTRLAGRRDRTGMARIARLSTLSCSVLLGCGWVALLLFGPAIMRAWTGGRLQPDTELLGLVATAALLHGLWLGPANLLLAVNRQAAFATPLLLSTATVACLAWPLARVGGLHGIAALTLAGEATMAAWLWHLTRPKASPRAREYALT